MRTISSNSNKDLRVYKHLLSKLSQWYDKEQVCPFHYLRNQKSTDENKCVDNLPLQFFSKKQLSYYRLYLMSIDK